MSDCDLSPGMSHAGLRGVNPVHPACNFLFWGLQFPLSTQKRWNKCKLGQPTTVFRLGNVPFKSCFEATIHQKDMLSPLPRHLHKKKNYRHLINTNEHSVQQIQYSRLPGKPAVKVFLIQFVLVCGIPIGEAPRRDVTCHLGGNHYRLPGTSPALLSWLLQVSQESAWFQCHLASRAFYFLRPLVCLIWFRHLTSSFHPAPSLTLPFSPPFL